MRRRASLRHPLPEKIQHSRDIFFVIRTKVFQELQNKALFSIGAGGQHLTPSPTADPQQDNINLQVNLVKRSNNT